MSYSSRHIEQSSNTNMTIWHSQWRKMVKVATRLLNVDIICNGRYKAGKVSAGVHSV